MSVLIIQPSGGASYRVPLGESAVRIGRSKENEVCLADDAASSRFHAEVTFADGSHWLADLGSHNGTLLDGRPVQGRVEVRRGSRIQVGRTLIVVAEAGDTGDVSAAAQPWSAQVPEALDSGSVVLSVPELLASGTLPGTVGDAGGAPGARAFAALSQWASELMSDRPLAEVFETVLAITFRAVAPMRGAILLLDGDPPTLDVVASSGIADEGNLVSKTITGLVLEKRQSVLTSNALDDPRFMNAESVGLQAICSAMSVPLWNNREVIGMIYVDTSGRPGSFSKVDLEVLTLIANLAAIKIDHTRLAERDREMQELEQELQAAARMQRRLLPAEPPSLEGYELYGTNLPCHAVGGDYYDFQLRPNGRLALAIGDVSGKGMGAALLMATLQAAFRAHAATGADPSELVARLNRAICENSAADKFITFFYGELDPSTGELEYVNAGHNPPLLFRAGDAAPEPLLTGGKILGFRASFAYDARRLTIAPGDLLFLHTDGINESRSEADEEFGEERMIELVRSRRMLPVAELGAYVQERIRVFTGPVPPFDDLTLCLLRRS